MKKLLSLIIVTLMFAACGPDNNSSAKQQARESIQSKATNPAPLPDVGTTTASGAVQHYICPNNCEGSGGAAQGNCPVCGTAYVHNQAFHSQPAATTPPSGNSGANAAGVFHYICSNGCPGGSGAQGNCATCGNALVHNQAFHN